MLGEAATHCQAVAVAPSHRWTLKAPRVLFSPHPFSHILPSNSSHQTHPSVFLKQPAQKSEENTGMGKGKASQGRLPSRSWPEDDKCCWEAGSPPPFEDQHGSRGLAGRGKCCLVCTCNSIAHSSSREKHQANPSIPQATCETTSRQATTAGVQDEVSQHSS